MIMLLPFIKKWAPYRSPTGPSTGWTEKRLLRWLRANDPVLRPGSRQMNIQMLKERNEYEHEAYFDYILTKNGVRDKAFKTIAASGKRGTILHYVENNAIAEDGDLILVDCGAQVGWYCGDITRTYPVNGKFTPLQKQIYDIVLSGQQKVIDSIKPGLMFSRLNEILKEHYFEELKKIGLVETFDDVAKYYYHGVSHYLGAETHDIGRYGERALAPGMVFTVEPGLYIEEYGIGIRIEDDVLVTENGCEVLSAGFMKTTDEIEEFMGK